MSLLKELSQKHNSPIYKHLAPLERAIPRESQIGISIVTPARDRQRKDASQLCADHAIPRQDRAKCRAA